MSVSSIEKVIVIHPRSIKGRFRSFKTSVMVMAYAIFFILPWIPWSRTIGPNQAISFDLVAKKFYVLNLVIYAQDIFWLAALLFLAAVLLFFATALLGRVFCGYFCFQTLWTDAFRFIERFIQGDRVARMRLDKAPWSVNKLAKIGATHALWLFLALWTGLSFILYWGYAPDLTYRFFLGDAPSAAYMSAFGLMATTYLAAGVMREKVCMHICPYARFQSVMIDEDTLIPTYDPKRGEGAAGRAKPIKSLKTLEQRKEQGVGDCVDCGLCVQVCPVGIDIRDGMQYPCIHCGLCIDACDKIMDARKWPRGLIRYESEEGLETGKTRFFKLRTYGYGLATLGAVLFLAWSISGKKLIDASVYQTRSPLFVMLSDGQIQNRYSIKLDNKTQNKAQFKLSLEGLDKAEIDLGKIKDFTLQPDESQSVMVKIRREKLRGGQKNKQFRFVLTPIVGDVKEPIRIDSQFISP
jgi:cytochrome c oxidase accessory protein FixG